MHKTPKNRPKLKVTHALNTGGNKTKKTKRKGCGMEVAGKVRFDIVKRDVKNGVL